MAIEDSESLAGWIAGGPRFLAILVLPALALFIYRRIVKEQVVARRREFEAKLDYERRLKPVHQRALTDQLDFPR